MGNTLTFFLHNKGLAMPSQKVESFNFRVEPELKVAFVAAPAAEDRPAKQLSLPITADTEAEAEIMDGIDRVTDRSFWV